MATSSTSTPDAVLAAQTRDAGTVRDSLGLRPISYAMSTGHPDRRPCPSWCWVGRAGGEFEHEIMARHPMKALHEIESAIRTVASLYPGEPAVGVGDRTVGTATVESDLTQLGSADPVISVYLRRWDGQIAKHDKRLALTLEDAKELAAALTYLVGLATGDAP
jgi:hypothetical protein